jgi:hypothetical protein
MAYIQPSSPLNIKEAAYEKSNRKMRKENPGMGKRLTKGKNARRVSFVCRHERANEKSKRRTHKESNGFEKMGVWKRRRR